MNDKTKIFFASDFHLGIPDHTASREREDKIVQWLDTISKNASDIYLMGDLFDFWFEYKKVVPKGHIRLLGKLAELSDKGVKLHIFKGNHDLWMKDYFQKELKAEIHSEALIKKLGNRVFYIAHGDGLGPGDYGFKFMKAIFKCKFNQWLFRWLHPDIGSWLANFFSRKSRIAHNKKTDIFKEEKEWLVMHARQILQTRHIDYFVFGHRHVPAEYKLNDQSTFFNLGDWITHFTYLEFDGEQASLKKL